MAARLPRIVVGSVFALLTCAGSGAWGQALGPQQVLERLAVFNGNAVLEMSVDGSGLTSPDFTDYGVTAATGFTACQLHPTRGLYCLDGRDVRRWQDPTLGGVGAVEFSCANPSLPIDVTRSDVCSTMAVAPDGSVWISGRRGTTFRLIKLVPRDADGSCAEGAAIADFEGVTSAYCFRQYAARQPRMLRLLAVERSEAAAFDPGTGVPANGVLSLHANGAAKFFSSTPGAAPRVLVSGRTAWGVSSSNELIQDLALLQIPDGAETDNFLLATTGFGRVIARQTDLGAPAASFTVFRSPTSGIALPDPRPAQCAFSSQRFGIAASSQSGRAYLTDRDFCQVSYLEPSDGDESDADNLPFIELVSVQRYGDDLTLSTVAAPVAPGAPPASYPPDGPSRVPGVIIDLAECAESCVLRRADDGTPVATLFDVQRSTEPSLMLLLQAINVPDCRYVPAHPACVDRDAVIGPPGDPDAQYLDLAKVLPADITDQFASLGTPPPGLPPLLIPPNYRGQASKDFLFGLFFGITPEGTVFINTFNSEWDVEGLSGSELGCELGYPRGTPLGELLSQDVLLTVSERYIAAGGPAGVAAPAPGASDHRYVGTIINNGCGSSRGGGVRWSAVAYDLEIAHNPTPADDQDDVFADLLERLMAELEVTQREIACRAGVDSPDSGPLPPAVCSTLDTLLTEASVKLGRCLAAARGSGKPSLLPPPAVIDFYCSRFATSFQAYRDALALIPPGEPDADPANRIGELKLRGDVFDETFVERFLPSVPPGGFTAP
jgi:hypothetical protein